jgi:hypothetical protein
MKLDSSANRDLASDPIVASRAEPVVNSPAAWHRPAITIMNIKRTMFSTGSFLDGVIGSTS